MKSLYFLLLSFLLTTTLFGQNKSEKKQSSEIGLNITNTLAGFFNAGGSDLPRDPFLFSYKKLIGQGNSALRFGANFRVINQTDFLLEGQRETKENDFFFRAGYEWRGAINKRFTMYYGLDGVLEYEQNESGFTSFFGNEALFTNENIYGFGGGPVLGMLFHLNSRIALSTEGAIYGIVQRTESKQDIGNGLPPVENRSNGFKLLPSVPSSLYVIFSF